MLARPTLHRLPSSREEGEGEDESLSSSSSWTGSSTSFSSGSSSPPSSFVATPRDEGLPQTPRSKPHHSKSVSIDEDSVEDGCIRLGQTAGCPAADQEVGTFPPPSSTNNPTRKSSYLPAPPLCRVKFARPSLHVPLFPNSFLTRSLSSQDLPPTALPKPPTGPSSRPPLRLPNRAGSLSNLSVYRSQPHAARHLSTPIPPSLVHSQLITSRNSPFHYLAVEGREWDLGRDGHKGVKGLQPGRDGVGAGGTREDETARRSEWATDVLGTDCGEGRVASGA